MLPPPTPAIMRTGVSVPPAGRDAAWDDTEESLLNRWDTFIVEGDRCLYENDDILVTHAFVTFPNGTKDAVMMVHMKKDGLLWRTETGSTPIPTS